MPEARGTRLESNTVFVLGAGFTKAFLPNAPLLVDAYGCDALLKEFDSFPTAKAILEREVDEKKGGLLDLERAMTRASAGMPYDPKTGAAEELSLLFSRLKQAFERKLDEAKQGPQHTGELATLAQLCVERRITCVTFNYDDLLDAALSHVRQARHPSTPAWNPNGGYGFFCRPAWSISGNTLTMSMGRMPLQLLKLHGSVNWRIKLGYSSPLSADALVHSEKWITKGGVPDPDAEELERHMEPSPFLVPPILTKDALIKEPILRLIWSRAFQALRSAELVVFVGYSFPVTDIAARFLFTEAIRSNTRLRVVNFARNKTQEEELRANYRRAFPGLRHDQFSFEGALNWSQALLSNYGRFRLPQQPDKQTKSGTSH